MKTLSKNYKAVRSMTFLALIAAAVLGVWGAVYARHASVLFATLVFVMISAIFGHQFWHSGLGPIPISLDRIWLAAVVAIYAYQRWAGLLPSSRWSVADVLLVVLVGWMMVSMLTSEWFLKSPTVIPPQWSTPVWRLTGGYVMPLVAYWMARHSRIDQQSTRWLQIGLAVFGLYLGTMGILEITKQWSLVFPRHIADPTVGIHFGRARGPTGNGINFGHCVAVCAFACLLMLSWVRGVWRFAVAGVGTLCLAGVYFCYTRSVWLGALAGGFLVLLGSLPLRWRGPLVLTAVLGAAGLWTVRDQILGFEREFSASETLESATMRGSFAYVSWLMIKDHPLTGVGFGHFAEEKLQYLTDRHMELELGAIRQLPHHNTFLSLITESGPLALVLFLGFLAAWVWESWLLVSTPWTPSWAKAQALLGVGGLLVYAAQLAFHELSFAPIQPSMAWMLAGITMGMRPEREPVRLLEHAAVKRYVRSWMDRRGVRLDLEVAGA